MKVTIEIPDDLFESASSFAKQQKITFSELVTLALRAELNRIDFSANAIARLRRGYKLGLNPPLSREDAHKRANF
jgi:hypothetical protein